MRFSFERNLIKLSLPIFIGMVFELVCSLLDTVWVARIAPGDTAVVSGVGLAYPAAFLLVALAQGIGGGVATIAAIAAGQNDIGSVKASGRNGLWLGAASGLLITALVYLFRGPLVELLAGDSISGDAKAYAASYLMCYMPGVPFLFAAQALMAVLQGEGKTKHIGIATSVSTGINAALDPVFIFVFKLGVEGAALTTSLAQVILFAWMLIVTLREEPGLLSTKTAKAIDFGVMKRILGLGMPQTVSFIILSASFAAMNWFVSGTSEAFMNAYTLAGRFDGILLTPTLALSIGLSILVGQNYGGGNAAELKGMFRRGTAVSLLVSLVLGLIYMAAARPIFALMSDNPDVVSLAVTQVYWLTLLSGAGSVLGLSAGSALQAVEKPLHSTLIMLLRMLLIPVALAAALQAVFGIAPANTWVATGAGSLLGGAIGYVMAQRCMKRLGPSCAPEKTVPAETE